MKGSKFRITQQAHWKALDFQFVRSQQHSVVVGTQSMHMQLQWQSMVLMVRLVEAPALVIRWSLTTLSALISYSLEALCSNQTAVSTNICATVARCDTLCCSSALLLQQRQLLGFQQYAGNLSRRISYTALAMCWVLSCRASMSL